MAVGRVLPLLSSQVSQSARRCKDSLIIFSSGALGGDLVAGRASREAHVLLLSIRSGSIRGVQGSGRLSFRPPRFCSKVRPTSGAGSAPHTFFGFGALLRERTVLQPSVRQWSYSRGSTFGLEG